MTSGRVLICENLCNLWMNYFSISPQNTQKTQKKKRKGAKA